MIIPPDTKSTQIKTFEMIQYVTGPVVGEFNDWPPQLQDAIYKALELKSKEVELPLAIVGCECDKDYGEAVDGSQDKWYLRVIASEVVLADRRVVEAEQKLVDDFMKSLH